jgi:hypothetical protein
MRACGRTPRLLLLKADVDGPALRPPAKLPDHDKQKVQRFLAQWWQAGRWVCA